MRYRMNYDPRDFGARKSRSGGGDQRQGRDKK